MFTKRSALLVCLAMAALALPAALLAQTPACSVFVYPRFVAPNATTGTPGTGTPLAVYAALYPQASSLPDTYAVKFRGGDGLSRGLTWMPVGDFNPANWDTGNWYADAATWLTATRQFYFTDANPRYFWVQGKVLNTSTAGPDTFRVRIRLLQPGTNYDSPVYEVTALDMAINGGWIEGNVYSDAGFTTPHQRHVVLAFKADTIASVYLTENNKIREGYDSTSAGYFRMAVPAGNIDSIQVRDTLNNVVASYVQTGPPWTISAGQATSVNLQDTIPPSIVWTSPAYGATDVGLSEPIVIAFSEPMDTASVTGYPSGNSFTISWNAASDTMTLTPQFAYQYGTLYWLIATAGTDLAGNSLPDLPDTAVYFTTIANQGPAIVIMLQPGDTYDGSGPFLVRAVITDPAKVGIAADTLWYTDNATDWWAIIHNAASGDTFDFSIPGPFAPGTVIEYFLGAWDDQGAVQYDPGMFRGYQFRILDPLPPTALTATAGDMMVQLDWAPPAQILAYDDGVPALYWYWAAGDIFTTRFTPQHYPCKLEQSMSVWYDYGAGTDSVEVHVWPDDGTGQPDLANDLVPPFKVLPTLYPDWNVIDLSGYDIVLMSGDFHVGFVCQTTNQPTPVSDGNGPGIRSMVRWAGAWGNIVNAGDYFDFNNQAAVTYAAYTKGLALKSYAPRKTDKPLPMLAGLKANPITGKQAMRYPELRGALAMAKNITGVEILRGDAPGGPYTTSLGTTPNVSLIDASVTNGNTYYYVARAHYSTPDTFSAFSNEDTASPAGNPILLVDDDGQVVGNPTWIDGQPYYTAALDGAGYTGQYSVFEKVWGVDGPAAAWYQGRDAVIWFTSYNWNGNLSANDMTNLAGYLDAGGKLFLCGQDVLYYTGLNTFTQNYLGVQAATQDGITANVNLAGMAGSLAEGYSYALSNTAAIPELYGDDLTAIGGAGYVFDVTAKVGEKPAIQYDNGTFRSVFFAFPFENLVDGTNTKDELMYRILNWMSTGVEGPSTPLGVPTSFSLAANYPNPVRTSTTIKFGLPKESQVRVEVYNIAGQRVKTLASGKLGAGYHNVTWKGANDNGQKVAAGVYLVRMVTPEFSGTRKMTVIR